MSKRIFKYEIPVNAELDPSMASDVMLPQHAAVLSVGTQGHAIYAWALVDPDAEVRHYAFKVLGTGWKLPDDELDGYSFLGTVQMKVGRDGMTPLAGSELVWHVWVRP